MRFLADAGISPKTIEFLRQRGHDAVHAREIAMERAKDREVIERAREESRIALTFDLDFGGGSRPRCVGPAKRRDLPCSRTSGPNP